MILNVFKYSPSQQKTTTTMKNNPKVVEPKKEDQNDTKATINTTSIGTHSRSQVPPFLLTFEVYNFNVHNLLVDFDASSNFIPYSIFHRINIVPEKSTTIIIQLDMYDVKVMGGLKDVMIKLAYDSRFHQVIAIIIVDIP
jgi:hypothetical protein